MHLTKAKQVYALLQEKKGKKMVTVVTENGSRQFLMTAERMVDEVAFFNIVNEGLRIGGSLVLRHYNGKTEDIYGAALQQGQFIPLPKETMEKAHTTHAQTGKHMPKEENVAFCAF